MEEFKRDIPLGQIICDNKQTVYAQVITDKPLKRGTLLLTTDGGVTFSVVQNHDDDANGVLIDCVENATKAAILVTGSVVEANIIGLREDLKQKLFQNKIILK